MAPTPGADSANQGRRQRGSTGILHCVAITTLVLIVAVGLAVLIHPAPLKRWNGGEVAVYYDAMEVRVVYDDQAMAWGEVAPFLHRHDNATEIQVPVVARSA
ncbi:hypothetical protein Taro_056159 [Colocasia esculenta]|uniref:Uncharacterized protein n=1 Tax=Colocasia esculenta TaxID=4460 RepID=A0A843XSS8_COLES|nr:hypothetical protein [Colocasia esculenta]